MIRSDKRAFDRLYDLYAQAIFRYLYYRLGNRHTAEDLTADVFVRLLERIRTYRIGTEDQKSLFSGWLYRIAHNLMVDHLRKASSKDVPVSEIEWVAGDADLAGHMAIQETAQTLDRALKSLKDEQRQVILLRFFEDLSLQETAGVLGKTEGAVKALQHRALARLNELVKKHQPA